MDVKSFFTEPSVEPKLSSRVGEQDMKAGIIFTGTGPIVVLTSCESLDDPRLIQRLNEKGIKKFIAYELPIDKVRQQYGLHYSVTLADRAQTDVLRVVDYDGERIMNNFPLDEMKVPLYCETVCQKRAA
jgi:hypothetical protein